jgi:hypothetical protein
VLRLDHQEPDTIGLPARGYFSSYSDTFCSNPPMHMMHASSPPRVDDSSGGSLADGESP